MDMKTYNFDDKMFDPNKPWYPYYEKYKGHDFIVDHVMVDNGEEIKDHVWLECVDDSTVIVDGYVHLYDLVEI